MHSADISLYQHTHVCPAAGTPVSLLPPPHPHPPSASRGKSLLFYTSCWCEPSLPLHYCFSRRLKQKREMGLQHRQRQVCVGPHAVRGYGPGGATQTYTQTDTQQTGYLKRVSGNEDKVGPGETPPCLTLPLSPTLLIIPTPPLPPPIVCFPPPCPSYRSASQNHRAGGWPAVHPGLSPDVTDRRHTKVKGSHRGARLTCQEVFLRGFSAGI